jgi:hypothetical protein
MKISLTPESSITKSRLSILTLKQGLYAGPIPNIRKFLVPEVNADAFLCPHNLRSIEKDTKYLKELRVMSERKPVILFNMGDYPRKKIKGNFIYIQTTHEVGHPLDTKDTIIIPLNVRQIKTQNRSWRKGLPVVSFVGQVPNLTLGRWIRSFLPIPPMAMGKYLPAPIRRNSALIRKIGTRILMEKDSGFTITRKFHGGSLVHVHDEKWNRKLYEQVIENSDFIFSPRGDANNAYRLYEAISAGRIPIVPATSIYLPALKNSDAVDIIRVTRCLSGNLWTSVENFWSSIDENSYREIQNSLRKLFKEELSYEKYLLSIFHMSIGEIREMKPIRLNPNC